MPIGRADHTEGVAPPSAGGEDGCCRTAAPRAAVHRHRLQPYVHQRHVISVSVAKPGGGTIATLAKKVFAMNGDVTLASFPAGGTALVIGASGAIGAAFVEKLRQAPSFVRVIGLGRTTAPALDVTVEASISAAATAIHVVRTAPRDKRHGVSARGGVHAGAQLASPETGTHGEGVRGQCDRTSVADEAFPSEITENWQSDVRDVVSKSGQHQE